MSEFQACLPAFLYYPSLQLTHDGWTNANRAFSCCYHTVLSSKETLQKDACMKNGSIFVPILASCSKHGYCKYVSIRMLYLSKLTSYREFPYFIL